MCIAFWSGTGSAGSCSPVRMLGPQGSTSLANKESCPWGAEGEWSTCTLDPPGEAGKEMAVWGQLHGPARDEFPGPVPLNSHLLSSPCSWEPIEKYINEQYEKFLKEEVNIARKKRIPDTRVHCCLYFISPTGHS